MTLTETAQITKRGLRAVLIIGGTLLLLWISFLYIYNNIYLPRKNAAIKPEMAFKGLPAPLLGPSQVSSSTLTYNLDTDSGFLPAGFPRLIKIYFIPTKTISLLGPAKAQSLAQNLGFSPNPNILSPTEYQFSDNSGGQLNMDLNSGNFHFERKITQTDGAQVSTLPEAEQMAQDFKSYLSSKSLLNDSLQNGPSNAVYDQGTAKSSNTAVVSLWPDKQDDLPIVSTDPNVGLVSATVTKYTDEPQKYISLNYAYWPVDPLTSSTYQLTTVDQSFENLKKGYGVIVQKPDGNTMSINTVYLAYFMAATYQPYLEPVYVFKGDNFTAYVPALTPDSYAK